MVGCITPKCRRTHLETVDTRRHRPAGRRSTKAPREVDRTVDTIAAAQRRHLQPRFHQAYDPSARPEFIAAHVRRLEAMRRIGGSCRTQAGRLLERSPKATPSVARYSISRAEGAKVELLSPVRLGKSCRADAPAPGWIRSWWQRAPTPDPRRRVRPRGTQSAASASGMVDGGRTCPRRRQPHHLPPRYALAPSGTGTLCRQATPMREALASPMSLPTSGQIEGVYREPVQLRQRASSP